MNTLFKNTLFLSLLFCSSAAFASGTNFNSTTQLPITPNVSGNVGVGSSAPGQALDVQGTVRTIGFTMSGQTPVSGFVLTASDSNGDATWTAAGVSSGWTVSGINVYETGGGNVGIGTAVPINTLAVVGNETIGSAASYLSSSNAAPANGLMVQGNVGIGTFYASGNNLTIGVNNANGGTVGIGTNTNANSVVVNTQRYSLEINGLYGLVGIFSNSSNRQAVTEYGDGTGTALGYTGFNGSNMAVMGEGFADNLVFGANNTEAMRIASGGNVGIGTTTPAGGLTVMNGNVGIGTWVPRAQLDVEGTLTVASFGGNVGIGTWTPTDPLEIVRSVSAGAGPIIRLTNNAGAAGDIGRIDFNDTGTDRGYLSFVVTPGGPGFLTWSNLDFSGQINEKFRIDPNGNVGIGTFTTANPTSKLGVAGNIGIGTNSSSPYVAVNSPGAGSMIVEKRVGIGTWLSANQLDVNGAQAIGSTYAGYFTAPSNGLMVQGSVGIGTWLPAGSFQVNSSSATPFIITPSGNVGLGTTGFNAGLSVMNGNVGIGTTNPIQTLEVNGEIIADVQYEYPGSWGPLADTNGSLYVPQELLDGNNSPGVNGYCLTSEGPGGQVAWAPCSGGNVGIGTGSPSAPLNSVQFNDANNFGGSSNFVFNGTNVGIGTSLSKNLLDIAGAVSIGTSYAGHVAGTPNGIIVQGNVDIGTFASANNLSVLGSMGIGSATYANSAGPADGLIVQGGVGIGTWTIANNLSVVGSMGIGSVAYANTAAPANGIIVQGNVGIGTLAPGQALDVQGTIRTLGGILNGNVGIGTTFVNGTGEAALTVMNGSVGIGTWVPATTFQLNGSSQNVYIASNGNLGIGIAAPIAPLQVGIDVAPDLLLGSGSATNNYMAVSGGRAMFGFDSAAFSNGALALSPGTNRGIEMFVAGSNNNFLSGTLALAILNTGDVGIGTTSPQAGLSVMKGNVGIGTWTAAGGNLIVNGGGNVGIGSAWPGMALDVQGTVRATGLTMSGQTPVSGYVLTASDSNGDATWTAPGAAGGWTVSGNNVYETSGGNVGIGTSAFQTALAVTNGNVGIGTWTTTALLQVGQFASINAGGSANLTGLLLESANSQVANLTVSSGSNLKIEGGGNANSFITLQPSVKTGNGDYIDFEEGNVGVGTVDVMRMSNGNVGIGSVSPGQILDVQGTIRDIGEIVNGNVGIGSAWPGQALDVQGTIRDIGEIVNGNTGIGTVSGGALVTVGGSCAAHQGTGVCFGTSTSGVTCLGYCTVGVWPNCTTCNCC